MYSTELKSDIAQFLAMYTDCMAKVRDHIPAGPEFFKFYFQDKELNWYEFWDHIAEVRPTGCRLVTNMFTIHFDEHLLEWICEDVDVSNLSTLSSVKTIRDALNENFIRSSTIISWNRYTINN